MLAHVTGDLEPHRWPEPATGQFALQSLQQILVAILDVHIGVAGDPEGMPLDDLHAGEQRGQERRDELFHRQEANGLDVADGAVEPYEPVDVIGHLHAGEVLAAVLGGADGDREVQAEPADERKRMGRIDGEWCQDREDLLLKIVRQVGAFGIGEIRPTDDGNSVLSQSRLNRI